jgi:hypothetical protein
VKERGFMLSSSVCIFSQVSEGWFEVEWLKCNLSE